MGLAVDRHLFGIQRSSSKQGLLCPGQESFWQKFSSPVNLSLTLHLSHLGNLLEYRFPGGPEIVHFNKLPGAATVAALRVILGGTRSRPQRERVDTGGPQSEIFYKRYKLIYYLAISLWSSLNGERVCPGLVSREWVNYYHPFKKLCAGI